MALRCFTKENTQYQKRQNKFEKKNDMGPKRFYVVQVKNLQVLFII